MFYTCPQCGKEVPVVRTDNGYAAECCCGWSYFKPMSEPNVSGIEPDKFDK